MMLVVADWYEKSTVRKFGPAQDAIQRIWKTNHMGPKKRNPKSIYILLGQQMSRGI